MAIFPPSRIWDNLGEYVFNAEQKGAMMERKESYFPQPEQREVRASVCRRVGLFEGGRALCLLWMPLVCRV